MQVGMRKPITRDGVDGTPLPLDEVVEVRPRPGMQIGGCGMPEASPRGKPRPLGGQVRCVPCGQAGQFAKRIDEQGKIR
ncbi:hypothetical protein CLV71_12649 [Actinophytocola oryzae]|uniref:Uncharacterized protein n=1 Tax=Actinophytocola oryzae TaxID=502181 RepID=A0A4R7USE9_9PSEU|nr:hypothetical protein CLV71_12649 [Actinophytocola oryzae]